MHVLEYCCSHGCYKLKKIIPITWSTSTPSDSAFLKSSTQILSQYYSNVETTAVLRPLGNDALQFMLRSYSALCL